MSIKTQQKVTCTKKKKKKIEDRKEERAYEQNCTHIFIIMPRHSLYI